MLPVPINIRDSDQARGVPDALWVPATLEIYTARLYNIYLVSRYPHQMLLSRDPDFNVRYFDWLMLIENKLDLNISCCAFLK